MFLRKKKRSYWEVVEGDMAEAETVNGVKEENKLWKGVFAVSGIMFTLVIYGLLQVCFLSLSWYMLFLFYGNLIKG